MAVEGPYRGHRTPKLNMSPVGRGRVNGGVFGRVRFYIGRVGGRVGVYGGVEV